MCADLGARIWLGYGFANLRAGQCNRIGLRSDGRLLSRIRRFRGCIGDPTGNALRLSCTIRLLGYLSPVPARAALALSQGIVARLAVFGRLPLFAAIRPDGPVADIASSPPGGPGGFRGGPGAGCLFAGLSAAFAILSVATFVFAGGAGLFPRTVRVDTLFPGGPVARSGPAFRGCITAFAGSPAVPGSGRIPGRLRGALRKEACDNLLQEAGLAVRIPATPCPGPGAGEAG